MSDKKVYFTPETVVGSGTVRNKKRLRFDQGIDLPSQKQFQVDRQLGDAPSRLMRIGANIPFAGKRKVPDKMYDRPIVFRQSKAQSPDLATFSFDEMVIDQNVAAGANQFTMLTVTIPQGIRAVIKRYGWYTNAAGTPNLQFGLYIGNELMAPGGKNISGSPATTQTFDPSGGSVDADELAPSSFPVEPAKTITVKVTNTDLVNAYPASARVWGWSWQEEVREAGDASWFNQQTKRIE